MLIGTVLGLFFVPLFFVVVQSVFARKAAPVPAVPAAKAEGEKSS
jgi:hypothetical protein